MEPNSTPAAQDVAETPATPPTQPSGPVPSIGRIVHYTLSEGDAKAIEDRRKGPRSQGIYMGNDAREGDVYPAMVVAVFGVTPDALVNLQVILDGYDSYWATSRHVGEGPATWAWPPRN